MELKDRKLINSGAFPKFNGGHLPGVDIFGDTVKSNFREPSLKVYVPQGNNKPAPSAAGIGPWFALGEWAGGGLAAGLNSTKGANELLTDAGTSTNNVGGINYQVLNDLNYSMGDYDKLTATSFLTNPFEGIGRLFSRSKQKDAIRSANLLKGRTNQFRFDTAATTAFQQKYASEHGNAEDQILYTAKNGKDVDTAYGVLDGQQNSWVNKGEFIFDTGTNIGHTVKRGPNDTAPAYLRGRDAVVTNKYGLADAAKSAYAAGDIAGVYDVLNMLKMLHNNSYKNGKDVPKFYNGIIPAWTNYLPNGIGALASIGLYIDAASLDIHRPDVYAANPYAESALRDMAGARYDAYPVAQALLKERTKTDRAIDASGGLSTAQRYLGKVANAGNYYNTMANVWSDFQKGNISLRQAYNQAKIAAGEQLAARRQSANQYNNSYYAQAHAAKQQGKQMGIRNFLDYFNNYAAMEFKRRLNNYMMGLYADLNEIEREALGLNKPKTSTTVAKVPGVQIESPKLKPSKGKVTFEIPTPSSVYLNRVPHIFDDQTSFDNFLFLQSEKWKRDPKRYGF